jgi:Zn-dependent protease with chaperone function
MSFGLRFAIVTLATFAAANALACLIVPWLAGHRLVVAAADEARALLRVRLLPTVFALSATALSAASFLYFEPREQPETMGRVLTALALLAATLLAISTWRAVRLVLETRRVLRAWMWRAEPLDIPGITLPTYGVDAAFPIVAVVGILRPRFVVARSVIEHCSPEELRAIFAHERAHIARGDNLARALFGATPDLIALLPLARRIARAWHEATEEAADDRAAELGPNGRVLLAQALIKVARIAPASTIGDLPASALYRGENIERRVRRLLAPRPAPPPRLSLTWRLAMLTSLFVGSVLTLHALHELVEAAVANLP